MVLFAGALDLAREYAQLSVARGDDGDRVYNALLSGGVFLNVTYLLEFVDCELATALQLDVEAGGNDA